MPARLVAAVSIASASAVEAVEMESRCNAIGKSVSDNSLERDASGTQNREHNLAYHIPNIVTSAVSQPKPARDVAWRRSQRIQPPPLSSLRHSRTLDDGSESNG